MLTSNEKYEQDIFESYREDEVSVEKKQELDEQEELTRAMAYSDVRIEVLRRNVSFRDLAEIAIDVLSDLELYELTAILNKHQKEKYEAGI